MQTIVLDTNCLLAAVPRRSKFYWLYELLKTGQLRLAVTTEILEEYEELLGSFYSPEFADLVLKTIINLPELEEVVVHFHWHLIYPDADDNKYVDNRSGRECRLADYARRPFQSAGQGCFPKSQAHFDA